jgi:hypothetical protein
LGCWVIPRYGYLGECVVITAIEIVLFATLAGHLSRMGIPAGFKTNFLKPVVAAAAMGLFLWAEGSSAILWTTLMAACGGVLYLLVLLLLRTFTPEEVAMAQEASGFLKAYWMTWRLKRGASL